MNDTWDQVDLLFLKMNNTCIAYDELKFANDYGFLIEKYNNYFWIPAKIVAAHNHKMMEMWVYTKIWNDIKARTHWTNREKYALYL